MTYKEYIQRKIFGSSKIAEDQGVHNEERLTFINDADKVAISKLKEYNVWYQGDGDELLNYYTQNNMIDYNYEPFYARNKRNYFWAISSTEFDIKRTHSGQPRNIVDTLVGICRFPTIKYKKLDTDSTDVVSKNLSAIIKDSNLLEIYTQEQLPLTLVDGWGCYKIAWNKDISEYPYLIYYRAEDVDFITSNNKIRAIVFKNYYVGENGEKYILLETRAIRYNAETNCRDLVITFDLFRRGEEDLLLPASKQILPELCGIDDVVIDNFDKFLAVPCILYKNTDEFGGIGRSIFTGKIDLFDDLDQCLSQASNAVRKSTPIEYFNSEFLERDRNGMPVQPKAYDRKYTMYQGGRNSDGVASGGPVQVTQPSVNFDMYSNQAVQILLQIINGIMSPATLGIDIAKKDNAEAQREKEKVTLFTRNGIIDNETKILKALCSQLLCTYQLMTDGYITVRDYDISVKFSEFADDSFENKLEKLGSALDDMLISEDMFMERLYGNDLPNEEYIRERDFIIKNHTKPHVDGMSGASGGGANLPGMMGLDQEAPPEGGFDA